MDVASLRHREDFDEILLHTLQRGLQSQHGRHVDVRSGHSGPGQRWWYQPLFSAFVTARPCPETRRFLRDSFRYTLVGRRTVPQWVLGSALGSAIGLRASRRPGFTIASGLPNAEAMAIVPGNHRVRLFDLGRRRTRAFLKQGFGPSGMRTEIELRASGREGPFPRIDDHDPDMSWFEEELLDGFTLARCPPWLPRRRLRRRSLAELESWAHERSTEVAAEDYGNNLTSRIMAGLGEIEARFDASELRRDLESHVAWLAPLAAAVGRVVIVPSHGDLQPGNIFVNRSTSAVTLIDWERYGRRSRLYDRFVLYLASRSARGLAERVWRFMEAASPEDALRELPSGRRWRRAHAAMFMLEDLDWFVQESQAGPLRVPSAGLILYRDELRRLRSRVGPPG